MSAYSSPADLTELGELVDIALDKCSAANTPAVCGMQATPAGRAQVRDAILRYCVAGSMSPGSALLELEREYTFTSHD